MTIARLACREDREPIERLASTFGTSFAFDLDAFRRTYSHHIDSKHSILLVAEQNAIIVGYLLAFRHETFFANGTVVWIEEIMVDTTVRRQGIGRLLMTHLEQQAQNSGYRLIALSTRRAADFYLALGYEASAQYFHKRLPPSRTL